MFCIENLQDIFQGRGINEVTDQVYINNSRARARSILLAATIIPTRCCREIRKDKKDAYLIV